MNESTLPIPVQFSSYAGYRAEERPLKFTVWGKEYLVQKILDQWTGPDYRYFKVRIGTGEIFILRYDEGRDLWELTMYQKE